ncbi:hypothetical protein B0H14DRAFT_3895061 [Mycena olivaceomarginata]|nr:hypothetical protein B0H14DRAFT_3895061 [Mycena olivaceomarginata]
MAWTCPAPFYPNHTNYTTDQEHNGNARKSWFLVLRAGLFTKRTDAEHQADVSGAPVFTFRTRAEAEAYWTANCRKNHPHNNEGSEEDGSPPPFSTPARSASRSAPVNAVRTSVKRESHASVKRKVRASVKHETPVKDEVEEAKTPLFREDSEGLATESRVQAPIACELAIVAQTQNICQRALGFAACARTQRLPHPSLQWDECGLDLLGVEPVGVRGLERVPRRASTSLSPPAPALLQTSCDPPSCWRLAKHGATAVREMGKGEESVQVLEVEDLEEFFSAPPHAAAA